MYGELKKIFESIMLVSECINIIRFIIEQYISQLKRLIITSAVITKNSQRTVRVYAGTLMSSETVKQNFTLSYPLVSKSAAIAGHITLFINILFQQMSLWLFQKSLISPRDNLPLSKSVFSHWESRACRCCLSDLLSPLARNLLQISKLSDNIRFIACLLSANC